jgi:hypothetical protein
MSSQRERGLDNLLNEIRELKERIKGTLPSYTASLKELSQLPDEFECRFWASCVEALVQKVKADYQKYQAQAQEADLRGKLLTLGLDIALRVGGMEPIPLPDSLRVGISMRPSDKIVPTLMDDPNRQPDAVFVTYEKFVAIAQRLKDELLKGTIVPASEEEIPRLIHTLALKPPGSFLHT